MNTREVLLRNIATRDLKVGVVGLGYVGLPLAVAFAQAGFVVLGVDSDIERVAALQNGTSYVTDVDDDAIAPLVRSGRLEVGSEYGLLAEAGAISICVPTPLRKTKDPDISHIIAATNDIVRIGCRDKLIVLESTTYPGTTEEIILPRLVSNGAEAGKNFFLAFSPERIDPGRQDYTLKNTPKVIGGITPACRDVAAALYATIVETVVPVSSTAAAEMVKLLENTFRAVNIGLVNEVALMCDRLKLDVWEVVEAAATKPYGFMPFYPGPGLGGHCIPVDPHYLSWKLRTLNYNARFIELASEVNSHMPDYVVGRIADALNSTRKPINGSRIMILGVAYKPDVGDTRESPAIDIIHLLHERGALLSYHDPHVPTLDVENATHHSLPLTDELLQEADCLVIVTAHTSIDWERVAQQAALILDTRNVLNAFGSKNILRL